MIQAIRPKLELLSQDLIKKIIDEALIILEKQGIFVENQEALGLLKGAGMKVDESIQRVFLSSQIIEDSLSSTPSVIKFYDRAGEKDFIVGEDEVHFNPGSAAVTILDHKKQEERRAVTEDLVKFIRLTESLEHIHFQSTGLISSDVPDIISDSYRLYIGLLFSTKPAVTGTFRVEGFKPMYDMLVAVRGSEKNLAEKPLAIFDACPSPPLKWSNLTTQSLIDSARAGIPSELISMGMTGATSPVTIAGTLVQHVAENLCGLVICQLAKKGAPVIFGGSPSSFDMRKGTTPMGAIETMMIDSAYSQIAKHLNLPTHAYMGLSDSKDNDNQAGLETGIGASQRDDPLAAHLFEGFTAETQFLSLPHTKNWYRKEHTFPNIIDRDTYDYWVSLGKKSIAERASEEVKRLLQENPPALQEKDVVQELRKIMFQDAKRNGISYLPELNI
jgi:trimethylamine--corrinoid protein Co-methyltransferase